MGLLSGATVAVHRPVSSATLSDLSPRPPVPVDDHFLRLLAFAPARPHVKASRQPLHHHILRPCLAPPGSRTPRYSSRLPSTTPSPEPQTIRISSTSPYTISISASGRLVHRTEHILGLDIHLTTLHDRSDSDLTTHTMSNTQDKATAPVNVKLLLIGNSSVGKSSLLLRFSDEQWLPEDESSATIGVDFRVRLPPPSQFLCLQNIMLRLLMQCTGRTGT